jgi:diguanylate cyclase (GGDEF)-like protein
VDQLGARVAGASTDLAAARAAARRCADSADALLGFSRSLAGLATARDVAGALAGAVAVVSGGASSSVLLWDALDERLRVQARSGGPAGADGADGANGVGAGGAPTVLRLGEADATWGPVEPELDDGLLRRSPVAAALMESREPAVVDRASQDAFVARLLEALGCEAAVLFPLLCGDEFLGMVTAEYQSAEALVAGSDAQLRELLGGLADLAVVALQNASLVEQVGDQALYDALTGLPNRRLLTDRVNQELGRIGRRGQSPTLLYLDVDRLHRVNQALGHAAGDELIRQVARRLAATVREQDTVARLGSDKLAVVLVGLSERAAVTEEAERILEALREPLTVAGTEIFTSASMGIAVAPRDGRTYEQLLAGATEAGRRSKANGRNTYIFASDAEDQARHGAELRADLRLALGRDELFVLYQPYVDLETTRVVGVEALVRWNHPERGVLEPAAFILEAEASDLIVGVDLFVMREACRQMRQWAEEGVTPMRVSVNVSERDLVHPGFVSSVSAALRDHGLAPEQLELEITERVVGDEEGVMQRAAAQLRQLGVRISLDDFGAGSASLQQLATFPVTTIKIDRSFLQLLGPPDELGSLATAIIGLAEQLGLHCVAEGVETSRQSRILLQRGCTTAQGFFFSPPLLPTDVKRMLQSPMRPRSAPALEADAAA